MEMAASVLFGDCGIPGDRIPSVITVLVIVIVVNRSA